MQIKNNLLRALTIIGVATPASLAAQDLSSDLATSDIGQLRGAVQMRFDAALAATRDDGLISADDPRYMWASEAKVQCGIALGFLKSKTRDETSLSKCDYAYRRMTMVTSRAPAPTPVRPLPPKPTFCGEQQPGIVFFEFDSDIPSDGAAETIQFVSGNAEACRWDTFTIVGHTDRAGSNAYNDNLSLRRAQAVADLMVQLGIDRNKMRVSAEGETNPRVPTEDGIRSPDNRRVEVTVTQ